MIKIPDCAFQDGSYPCDYKDGAKLPDCELCHKIRKAGIREVVEWINKTFTKTITIDQMMATNTWQAKLKEWGI